MRKLKSSSVHPAKCSQKSPEKNNIMDIRHHYPKGKHSKRPPSCSCCNSDSYWYGSRTVSAVIMQDEEAHFSGEIVRKRAFCPNKECPIKSWTIYEQNSYPHRTFSLQVVVYAVIWVVLKKMSLTEAAKKYQCSRTSIRRWKKWIEGLCDPNALIRACTLLHPDGMPGSTLLKNNPLSAKVLHLFDQLTHLFEVRAVKMPRGTFGLIRILHHQLMRNGDIYYLTKPSPPMSADFLRLIM